MSYFQETLDNLVAAYHTNLRRGQTLESLESEPFSSDIFSETVCDLRGFTYFFCLDIEMRQIGDQSYCNLRLESPLDLVVIPNCRAQRDKDALSLQDWISDMKMMLGNNSALDFYNCIQVGARLDLGPAASFVFVLDNEAVALRSTKQNPFDPGFHILTMTTKVVTGLIQDSNAANAGLREGDVLKTHSNLKWARDHYYDEFFFQAERQPNHIIKGKFRPRSRQLVESYETQEVPLPLENAGNSAAVPVDM